MQIFGGLGQEPLIVMVVGANVLFAMFRGGSGLLPDPQALTNPSNVGLAVIGMFIAMAMYMKWSANVEPIRELDRATRELRQLKEHIATLLKDAQIELLALAETTSKNLSQALDTQKRHIQSVRQAELTVRQEAERFENTKNLILQRFANVVDLHRLRLRPVVKDAHSYLDQPCDVDTLNADLSVSFTESKSQLELAESAFEALSSDTKAMVANVYADTEQMLAALHALQESTGGHDDATAS